jgi:hypothetical protein
MLNSKLLGKEPVEGVVTLNQNFLSPLVAITKVVVPLYQLGIGVGENNPSLVVP